MEQTEKKRWIAYQKENAIVSPTVPPASCPTRWSSTLKLTKYHAEHLDLYKEFFDAERRICDTSYLENLTDIFHKEPELRRLRTELTFFGRTFGRDDFAD